MQPCSWLLLTGPGWSKITSKSSIIDFLQNYFFFRKMWVEQNHNFLQKPLLSQTLDGRCSYIQNHLVRKGDLTGLMFRVLSWATGEQWALSPWHSWPRTATKVCLPQLPAWWRSGITFPCMSSHCPLFVVSVGTWAEHNMPSKRGYMGTGARHPCIRGCADHYPGSPFNVFSEQISIFVFRTRLGKADKDLPQCVSVHSLSSFCSCISLWIC